MNKNYRKKVSDFLNRDPATLVSIHKVNQLLIEGKNYTKEEPSWHLKQLEDANEKGIKLQAQLREFRKYGQPCYTEAKYFFAELFNHGINVPEAGYIREIMNTNVGVEIALSEELDKEKLIKLRDQ